jgi:two-component system LytT family response regulator
MIMKGSNEVKTLLIFGNKTNMNSWPENILRQHYSTYCIRECDTAELLQLAHFKQSTVLLIDLSSLIAAQSADAGLLFEKLRQLSSGSVKIVFLAATERFALHALKLSAVDYLLHPVSNNDLISAVDKAFASVTESLPSKREKLAVPVFDGISFVNIEKIIYCEGSNNYTYLWMHGGDKLLISRTLKDFEEQLHQHSFFRIHQKYLVNLEHVNRYIRGRGGYLLMANNVELPVSVRKRDAFLELAGRF